MAGMKPKVSTKSKSKSMNTSPQQIDIEQIMQPLKLAWSVSAEQRLRRPKSEIVQELRRLRTLPVRVLDNNDDFLVPDTVAEEATENRVADGLESGQAVVAVSMPVRTLQQLDALRLTRYRVEQLLHCTCFEQVVRNCFVRVNLSAPNTMPEYRIAEIVDISELPMGYYVGKTATNMAFELRYEDLVVQHDLNDISNMAFTHEEFEFWHDNCICQAIAWPTIDLIAQKKIDIYNALNSDSKVPSMLKQNGLLQMSMPMRPVPKGELLERFGGVYPWKLKRPPAADTAEEAGEETGEETGEEAGEEAEEEAAEETAEMAAPASPTKLLQLAESSAPAESHLEQAD